MNVKVGDKIRIVSRSYKWPEGDIDDNFHHFEIGQEVTVSSVYTLSYTILAEGNDGLVQGLHPCHYKKVSMRFTNK